jgi:hypothetical protein
MAIGPDALEPGQRELLRKLVRGVRAEEVADGLDIGVDQLDADARAALVALDPALAALVLPEHRRLLTAHVLRRDGDAGDVAEILDGSPDARRWLVWLGESLRVIAPDATLVALPGADADEVPTPGDDGTGDVVAEAAPPSEPDPEPEAEDHPDDPFGGAGSPVPEQPASAEPPVAANAPLTRTDVAILAATVVLGFVLLALGIALS